MGLHWGAILHLHRDAIVTIDKIKKLARTARYISKCEYFGLNRGSIRDMYRMCICGGVRDRGPGIVEIRAHLLWARNA